MCTLNCKNWVKIQKGVVTASKQIAHLQLEKYARRVAAPALARDVERNSAQCGLVAAYFCHKVIKFQMG